MAFDFEAGRFAQYSVRQHQSLCLEAVDEQSSVWLRNARFDRDGRRQYEVALWFCWAGADAPVMRAGLASYGCTSSRRHRSEYPAATDAFLRNVQFVDCRFPVLTDGFQALSEEAVELKIANMRTGDWFRSARETDGSIDVVLGRRLNPDDVTPEGVTVTDERVEWRFDKGSGMPLSSRTVRVLNTPSGPAESTAAISDSAANPANQFTWELVNNVYVIMTVKRFRMSQEILNPSQPPEQADAHRRWDFHWFSVNGELDEALFDGSVLQSREALLAAVDPERTGATSLVENPEGNENSGGEESRRRIPASSHGDR